MRKPADIDEYLESIPDDRRKALQDLRKKIRAALPKAEECISYGLPAFRVEGGVVAGFQAASWGCSYFPFSGRTLTTMKAELKAYEQTKGSLHFPANKPLPATLVKKLIRVRLAELKPRKRAASA
jgi:uncharacterized protein YdhG (YjbR/CyaY superfamily)